MGAGTSAPLPPSPHTRRWYRLLPLKKGPGRSGIQLSFAVWGTQRWVGTKGMPRQRWVGTKGMPRQRWSEQKGCQDKGGRNKRDAFCCKRRCTKNSARLAPFGQHLFMAAAVKKGVLASFVVPTPNKLFLRAGTRQRMLYYYSVGPFGVLAN